jgi:hypothetical protein
MTFLRWIERRCSLQSREKKMFGINKVILKRTIAMEREVNQQSRVERGE